METKRALNVLVKAFYCALIVRGKVLFLSPKKSDVPIAMKINLYLVSGAKGKEWFLTSEGALKNGACTAKARVSARVLIAAAAASSLPK